VDGQAAKPVCDEGLSSGQKQRRMKRTRAGQCQRRAQIIVMNEASVRGGDLIWVVCA
jgi:hypothetical protein